MFSGFRELLAPMMQRTISNSQVSRNLCLWLAALLDKLNGFLFEFLREDSLILWHDYLPLDALF